MQTVQKNENTGGRTGHKRNIVFLNAINSYFQYNLFCMKLTILGSGTSHGVPVIGCNCAVCQSADKRDNRLRCSALLTVKDKNYLIDVGPDFRYQALRAGLSGLEAVFLTHSHADHIHGIDDLRIFSHKNSRAMNEEMGVVQKYPETEGEGLPIYANDTTIKHIKDAFRYIFVDHDKGGGIPKLNLISAENNNSANPLEFDGLKVVPVPMIHGNHHTCGWVFVSEEDGKQKSVAYLTDCSFISDESIEEVKNAGNGLINHLVIDALRVKPHSSHNSFDGALAYAEKIGAEHTWFTHMTHDKFHDDIQKYVDEHIGNYKNLSKIVGEGGSVCPSYDGLELN